MAFYREEVFPRLTNRLMDNEEMCEIRARVCRDLEGEIVEIGFGTGLNLPHLPPGVTRLRAVDPSQTGARIAAKRIADSPVSVDIAGLDGQSLPFPAQSADAVLSTWTLCSIPDPVAAVREVCRVLRPGGSLHFAEHGAAPDSGVRRWQDRLNSLQQRLACGCNLNREILAVMEAGGLAITRVHTYYSKGQPKLVGAMYEGVATPA